jgi:hypothetical protein
MKIKLEKFAHGDGAHCGLTDWYPELEADLKFALESGQPFDTGWYSSKKEIVCARIWTLDGLVLMVEVSVSDDFDKEGYGYAERALPCTMENIASTVNQAWDEAGEDQKANANYVGYKLLRHTRSNGVSWVETYLVCLDGSDAPGGDFYSKWGWQGNGHKKLSKKTRDAFEHFANAGSVGEVKIGSWSIKSWHDTPPEFDDPNDYVGMGWVGQDGRP